VGDAAALPVPPIAEFVAPAGWTRIDFISDLHLAADMPRTFAAWAAWLRATPADAVFILGDLFDAWVGDDARHEGFEAECSAVLAEAAQRLSLAFMVGNRDFLAGSAWADACGLTLLADPTLLVAFGQRVLLTHGDALCLADTEYQRFRAQVRNPAWQAMVLTLPLAERRRRAAQMRHASEQRHAVGGLAGEAADIDFAAAAAWMRQAGAPVMIHGHTHRPATEAFGAGVTRHVLSDWDCDAPAPAAPRAQVLRLTPGGVERLSALAA
jgi:UDP-2,3-diacylglucosamine hydrolase